MVYLIFQRYKFKSKSQLNLNRISIAFGVFDISKIQIQKQITTIFADYTTAFSVYLIFQRYKFKSKSQHPVGPVNGAMGVFDISKIQIQKQITTGSTYIQIRAWVYLIFQRYKFKSKSQLVQRITRVKYGVFGISKIQI